MAKNKQPAGYTQRDCGYRYCSPNIPMSAIRRVARQIAEWFQPEKIILFGSYAYGRPHEWSDVDLLVVVPSIKTQSPGPSHRLKLSNAFLPGPGRPHSEGSGAGFEG